jgi:hypothetical protein
VRAVPGACDALIAASIFSFKSPRLKLAPPFMGNEGNRHPLARYIQAGVPVALATDDEGVSRSDMTQEYLRGALDQQLDY